MNFKSMVDKGMGSSHLEAAGLTFCSSAPGWAISEHPEGWNWANSRLESQLMVTSLLRVSYTSLLRAVHPTSLPREASLGYDGQFPLM